MSDAVKLTLLFSSSTDSPEEEGVPCVYERESASGLSKMICTGCVLH